MPVSIVKDLKHFTPQMNNSDFEKFITEIFEDLIDTNRSKGREYRSDQDGNVFDNFIRGAARLDLSPPQALAQYMFKHFDSIETWYKRGCPIDAGSEPMEGRFKDVILYMILQWAMYSEYKLTGRRSVSEVFVDGQKDPVYIPAGEENTTHKWWGEVSVSDNPPFVSSKSIAENAAKPFTSADWVASSGTVLPPLVD